MEWTIGIDLGTSNSCAAVWIGGKVTVVPDTDGSGYIAYSFNSTFRLNYTLQGDVSLPRALHSRMMLTRQSR